MPSYDQSETPDCSFVICVERGALEYKAILLILTLRSNWGKYASRPIYAFSPRPERKPRAWLEDFYDHFNVTPVYDDLNTGFIDYPLSNKPIAMRYAEENLTSKEIVFLDTDILCWNEPTHFDLSGSVDLKLSPDGTKTVASSGPGDKYECMWQELYNMAGIENPPWTRTHLTNCTVRNWWISSVIASRRKSGLMRQWLEVFEKVMQMNNLPREARYLREQISICLVAARNLTGFRELPISHNFPIQNHDHDTKINFDPYEACLWHYQPYLDKFFRKFSKDFDKLDCFADRLEFASRKKDTLYHHYHEHIGRDESVLRRWRRALRIGPRFRSALGIPKPTDSMS